MSVPQLSPTKIAALPNIFELIDRIKSLETAIHQKTNGWGDYSILPNGEMKLHPFHNISVNWHKRRLFTPDMLHSFYSEVKDKLWPAFCNKIDFFDADGDQLMDALLNIPNNPYYQQYFNPRQLELLQYHVLSDAKRASINGYKTKNE